MSLTTGCSGEGKSADRGGGGRHRSTDRAASTQREAGRSLRTLGTPKSVQHHINCRRLVAQRIGIHLPMQGAWPGRYHTPRGSLARVHSN